MSLIPHVQEPSTAVDLSGITLEWADDTLTLTGEVVLHGESFPLQASLMLLEGDTVFLSDNGVASLSPEGAFAHFAWRASDGLHFIRHVAAEPSLNETDTAQ